MLRFHAVVLCVGVLTVGQSSFAMGKKPPQEAPKPQPPAYTTPNPVRLTVVRPVGTKIFHIPTADRTEVDMTEPVTFILSGETAKTKTLLPTDPPDSSEESCREYLELRSAITAFQLDAYELGFSVGYSPGGESDITDARGEVNFKFGRVRMNFELWKCPGNGKRCTLVLSSDADEGTLGTDAKATIDFKKVTSTVQFIQHPDVDRALRKIMYAGMQKIATDPQIRLMPWLAQVFEVSPQEGSLWFDKGFTSNIGTNQTFTVYKEVQGASGACPVTKPIAQIHTSPNSEDIGDEASKAIIDTTMNGGDIQIGDLVKVRNAPAPPKN